MNYFLFNLIEIPLKNWLYNKRYKSNKQRNLKLFDLPTFTFHERKYLTPQNVDNHVILDFFATCWWHLTQSK